MEISQMIPLVCEGLAVISMLSVKRPSDKALRLLGLQCVIAFMVEITGVIMRQNHYPNVWLFNIYLPIDFILLLGAAHFSFQNGNLTIYLKTTLVLLCIIWISEIVVKSLNIFAVITFLFEALSITIAFLAVLYATALTHLGPFTKQPLFWISIGLITFYGCNVPYFLMLGTINKVCSQPQLALLYWVFICLSSFRYCCTSIGFILQRNKVI